MDFIKILRESDDNLLKQKAADISTWSKLKHNKEDLELFLAFNIAEVEFKLKDSSFVRIFCTANMKLVKVFNSKSKKDKQKNAIGTINNLTSTKSDMVNIWDLVENKLKTIPIHAWKIIDFISITPERVLQLDQAINKLLKK